MAKPVKMYRAKDGRLFKDHKKASSYEKLLELEHKYNEERIGVTFHMQNGYITEYVDWDYLCEWVKEHKSFLKNLLEVVDTYFEVCPEE